MGFLNIYKPSGPTSHDIVAQVRKATSIKQVGHAGTLDPLADGVLVVAVGYATRLIEYLNGDHKSYRVTARLGYSTDTLDSMGTITSHCEIPSGLGTAAIEAACGGFVGQISQVPPSYSAVKVKGKRAYDLARRGEIIELKPRQIVIYEIALDFVDLPEFGISVRCSSGTYVRSLIHDIGSRLGTCATMTGLTRLSSGIFNLENSVDIAKLANLPTDVSWSSYLIGPDIALPSFSRHVLQSENLARIMHGQHVRLPNESDVTLLGVNDQGTPVAVLKRNQETNDWWPDKVFNQVDETSKTSGISSGPILR